MKFISLYLLLLISISAEAQVHISQAFNLKAYFPVVGEPSQIDTIMGSINDSLLGGGIMNIGPRPGESFGGVSCIRTPLQRAGRLLSFDGGTKFNLHNLSDNGRLRFHIPHNIVKIGHFRDTYHSDILTEDGVIFWEDDQGNYDSLNSTTIWTPKTRPDGLPIQAGYQASVSHFYSDSVYDIFFLGYQHDSTMAYNDSAYLCHIAGGNQLHVANDTLFADSATPFYAYNEEDTDRHGVHRPHSMWTWEGSLNSNAPGMLSEDNKGNLFYYVRRNRGSLAELAYALTHDTLLANMAIPIDSLNSYYLLPQQMKVLSKQSEDSSLDLILPLYFHPDHGLLFGMFVFRGGSQFGTHRLTIDSAAFVFHNPYFNDKTQFEDNSAGTLTDCGDMTGRGNHMLCVQYWPDVLNAEFCFYELGTELDDKIDMYYFDGPGGGGNIDTISANVDGLEDVIVASPFRYSYDDPAHHTVGTLQIVYGSKNIPPRNSDRVGQEEQTANNLTIYPNPVQHGLALVGFDSPHGGLYHLRVRNLLGQAVTERDYRVAAGDQRLPLRIPELASGTYEVELSCGGARAITQIIVTQ